MVLNLVNVHQYHSPPKKSLQNSTHNLNFEIYLQIFIHYEKLCPQHLDYLTTKVPKQLIYNCIAIVPWK
jgi:hypothetical protein